MLCTLKSLELSHSRWESGSQGLSPEERGGWESRLPQPIPLPCSVPCQGLGQPTAKGNVSPTEVISHSSHATSAKKPARRQQPGTEASRAAVEKAKAGTTDTENIFLILAGLKLPLTTGCLIQACSTLVSVPSPLLCATAAILIFLSSPIVSHKSPLFLIFLIPE